MKPWLLLIALVVCALVLAGCQLVEGSPPGFDRQDGPEAHYVVSGTDFLVSFGPSEVTVATPQNGTAVMTYAISTNASFPLVVDGMKMGSLEYRVVHNVIYTHVTVLSTPVAQ